MSLDVDNAAEPAAGDVIAIGDACRASTSELSDVAKLKRLAHFFGSVQPVTPASWTANEAQEDLRRIAVTIERGGLALVRAMAICRAHGRDVVEARLLLERDKLIADLREEVRGAHGDALGMEQDLDQVRTAVECFVEDDECADEVTTIDLVLRTFGHLDRAESELELAKCWGAELVERLEVADEHVAALVECHEPAAERDVLVALVLRAAREMPELRARHNLLADLLALHPAALDGLSAPELERLRGRS